MHCEIFNCLLSTNACIRRQEVAKRNYVTTCNITKEEGGSYYYRKQSAPETFAICCECEKGKLVAADPSRFPNHDVVAIQIQHINEVSTRGFLHRERCFNPAEVERQGEIERVELNYMEGRFNVDMAALAEQTSKQVKRRRLNGKATQFIAQIAEQKLFISDRTARIIRYLKQQGGSTRSKSNLLSSIRVSSHPVQR